MSPPVIVCDVDDTLYLEHDYVKSGFRAVDNRVRLRYGTGGFLEAAWELFLSGRRGRIFDEVFENLGLPVDDEVIAELVRSYRAHNPDITLLPDAVAAIADWEKAGCSIAIVTDGPVASQRAKVRTLGLTDRVDPIVITEEHGSSWRKPNHRSFESVQAHHDGPAEKFVYVADNPTKDFHGPKSLGWRTYRVRRLRGLHVALASGADVDHESTDLADLLTWMGGVLE